MTEIWLTCDLSSFCERRWWFCRQIILYRQWQKGDLCGAFRTATRVHVTFYSCCQTFWGSNFLNLTGLLVALRLRAWSELTGLARKGVSFWACKAFNLAKLGKTNFESTEHTFIYQYYYLVYTYDIYIWIYYREKPNKQTNKQMYLPPQKQSKKYQIPHKYTNVFHV